MHIYILHAKGYEEICTIIKNHSVKLCMKFDFPVFELLLCLSALGFSVMNIYSVLQGSCPKHSLWPNFPCTEVREVRLAFNVSD